MPVLPTVWAHLLGVFFRGKCVLLFFVGDFFDKNLLGCIFAAERKIKMKKVGIVMGSDSDLPIIRKATDMLSALKIPFEVHIYPHGPHGIALANEITAAREGHYDERIARWPELAREWMKRV